MLRKVKILGIGITSARTEEVLEYIIEKFPPKAGSQTSQPRLTAADQSRSNRDQSLAEKVKPRLNRSQSEKLKIYTPNPEILVYADKHPDYKKILNEAEIALPDGIGVMFSSWLLGRPLPERITGTDFVEQLCKMSSGKAVRIGLLGGGERIAERAAECLSEKFQGLDIVFVAQEWPEDKNDLERRFKIQDLRFKNEEAKFVNHESYLLNQNIDILFVAFGAPKQEEWISKNIDRLPVKVMMGVGGAFDYISGNIPRAPSLVRRLGLEWLFRLIRQPWRWRRQIALLQYIYLIILEKIRGLRFKDERTA